PSLLTSPCAHLSGSPPALTNTAKDECKTYGTTFTPDGTTQFATSGLVNGDSVSSVTLTSSGYAATATVAGSPYAITPSAAVGSGLGNYTISYAHGSRTLKTPPLTHYANGSFTVNTAALTITANNDTKAYGTLKTFSATAFTATGLVNGDTITGVTETSAGAPASAAVGSYDIVPSAATGTGLSNYAIT